MRVTLIELISIQLVSKLCSPRFNPMRGYHLSSFSAVVRWAYVRTLAARKDGWFVRSSTWGGGRCGGEIGPNLGRRGSIRLPSDASALKPNHTTVKAVGVPIASGKMPPGLSLVCGLTVR